VTPQLRVRALDRARTRPGAALVCLLAFVAGALSAALFAARAG